jgi:hypothetical protein
LIRLHADPRLTLREKIRTRKENAQRSCARLIASVIPERPQSGEHGIHASRPRTSVRSSA